MASITCMFAAFSSARFTHIYLLGKNKSCMNYTNEMMHVQNGQGEIVRFIFYMHVMV